MRKTIAILVVIGMAFAASACSRSTSGVNMNLVTKRAHLALAQYDKYLKQNGITKVSDRHMLQLNGFLQRVLNTKPAVYTSSVATRLKKGASFEGFADANSNGKVDSTEKLLFTIEIDHTNKRIIATDNSGRSTGHGMSGTGFLTGMLLGSMMSRQRSSGISPNHFNNRKVTRARTPSRARRRARSGGLFGGK